jgi:hypothetical protein
VVLVTAVEPDAWDECATCGHDREDHNSAGCNAGVIDDGARRSCWCFGFFDAEAVA